MASLLLALAIVVNLLAVSGIASRLLAGLVRLAPARALDRLIRASRLPVGLPVILGPTVLAMGATGRWLWEYSILLAIVVALALGIAPFVAIWLRAAALAVPAELEVIAVTRQLAAHLRAGENLYRSIVAVAGAQTRETRASLSRASNEFRLDRPLATALARQSELAESAPLALLLGVLAQVADQGSTGESAGAVLDLLAQQLEQNQRSSADLKEQTRGVAIQLYVVAGAIPLMALWLWQTSPHGYSVFELPIGQALLLPFGVAVELLGLLLFWYWTRTGQT